MSERTSGNGSAPAPPPEILQLLREGYRAQTNGDNERAESLYRQVIAIDSAQFDALHLLGVIEASRRRFAEAEALIARALAINPHSAVALNNRGNTLSELNRKEDALASYDAALAVRPDYPDALNNRGLVLEEFGRLEEALLCYDRAIALNPNHAEALYNKANALKTMRRYTEALEQYDEALRAKPEYVEALINRGNTLVDMGRFDESAQSFIRALAIKPSSLSALDNLGNLLISQRAYGEAIQLYDRLLGADPAWPYARGNHLHARMHCCEWQGLDTEIRQVTDALRTGLRSVPPFAFQAVARDPADSQLCSQTYARDRHPAAPHPLAAGARYGHRKIRLGYMSGEFRAQATSVLAAGLFESHDRDRFDLLGFDNSVDDKSSMRARLDSAFGGLIDITRSSDANAAHKIREKEVDILVNLNGYFGAERTDVFAMRPAPVQVNFLGFPATMGTPYMDYLIADRIVILDGEENFYDEKIVRLPDSYQVNDSKRPRPQHAPSRADCGLPPEGFVFATFNNSYKFLPDLFGVWMRLLAEVPGSVIWILESNRAVKGNLRTEAKQSGIDPDRLVFAPSATLEDHLARHRHADLFLDTLPYNAHTTASDALWMGVPVLTCKGTTFPGRVAASLLEAIGLSELVTSSLEDYQALARALARDPARLATLKTCLDQERTRCALFDTDRFRQHIESAFTTMWERNERGLAPQGFDVVPG